MNPQHGVQLYAYYEDDAIVPTYLRGYGIAKEDIAVLPNHRLGKDYVVQNTETTAIDKPNERCDPSTDRVPISKCVSSFVEDRMGCATSS